MHADSSACIESAEAADAAAAAEAAAAAAETAADLEAAEGADLDRLWKQLMAHVEPGWWSHSCHSCSTMLDPPRRLKLGLKNDGYYTGRDNIRVDPLIHLCIQKCNRSVIDPPR
jgi:hypothetical protein